MVFVGVVVLQVVERMVVPDPGFDHQPPDLNYFEIHRVPWGIT